LFRKLIKLEEEAALKLEELRKMLLKICEKS
jgi:hypothetical protein